MVNTSFDFYKSNVPYQYPQIFNGKWDSGSTTTITATPYTGHMLFISELRFLATSDFALSAGTMTVAHSSASSNEYLSIEISEEEELFALASELKDIQFPASTYKVHGVIKFDPPPKMRQTSSQTMTISASGLTVAGSIWMGLHGWSMTENDFDEVA
jgi:hypothetical protein